MVLSNVVAAIWLALDEPGTTEVSLGGQALAALGLWTGMVGSVVFASYRKGSRSLGADFGFALRPIDAVIGVVTGVLSQVVLVQVIAFLLRPLLGDPDVSGANQELIERAKGVGLVVLVLFVVVGAAFVEELFFRGLLLRALEKRFGTAWAVVGSGVLFGPAHLQALPVEALVLVMVSLAALGVVFAILAVRTGRLGPSIVAHATFNAWTVAFLLAK